MPDSADLTPEWKRLLHECGDSGFAPERLQENLFPSDPTTDDIVFLARQPEIYEQSFRRGLVLCAAGEGDFTAALFWRGHIFGLYRHNITVRGLEGALLDLKEFRLGWLPDEVVRQTGGEGAAFTALPPEAEGFPLVCVTGPCAGMFAGHGKIFRKKQ